MLLKYLKLGLCEDNFRESRSHFFENLEDKRKVDEQKKILQKEAERQEKKYMQQAKASLTVISDCNGI